MHTYTPTLFLYPVSSSLFFLHNHSSEHSTFTSNDGILCRYGHRPYILDSPRSKSSTLPYEEPSSGASSGSQREGSRPYGSYFSSYGQQQSRAGGRDQSRPGHGSDTQYNTRSQPSRAAGSLPTSSYSSHTAAGSDRRTAQQSSNSKRQVNNQLS